ncbi:TRAP transporter large permease [Limnohabitans sp.]|uniref:TRAP transporter large permease n=1 Tax=Limnohabitans sp. TaxID=1907725 RepID=UPI0038BB1A0E
MIISLCVGFLVCILVGVPIAFSMIIASVIAVLAGDSLPLPLIAQRLGSGIDNFTYLAIPLFILAGSIMERSAISVRLVGFAKSLVGHLKGGMGQVVIVSEIFFSGISGASLSDASAIGSIMFPTLKKAGYDPAKAVALISAACAMGILIPPCLTMVVLGALAGVSVSALFVAGFIPGFLMAIALMVSVYFQSKNGSLPPGEKKATRQEILSSFKGAMFPLLLPIIIFGGILGGVFSPTEAAAVAVVYALFVATFIYREMSFKLLYTLLIDTAITTGAIGLILGAASAFSAILSFGGVPDQVAEFITGFSSNPLVFLIAANLVFLFFGAILDGIPALLLFVPILLPVAKTLGIDTLHFALMSVASLGVGLVVPPIGILVLVVCSITKTPLGDVSKAMMPYLGILMLCLLAMILFPPIILFLPHHFGL